MLLCLKRMVLTASLVFAATLGYAVLTPSPGEAAPCAQGSLATYIGVGVSCTIDDKLFFNFKYSPFIKGTPSALDITVTPLEELFNPGLKFASSKWSVGFGQEQDALIEYSVQVAPGGAQITDVSASLSGADVKVSASVGLEKVLCSTPTNCPGGMFLQKAITSGAFENIVDGQVVFGPTSFIIVQDFLSLAASALPFYAGSAASLSSFQQNFSEEKPVKVPEPATLALWGIGLAAVVLTRARRWA